MRVHEICRAAPLLEMSYSRRKAETIITGLEKPVNDHLLKLQVVEDHPTEREHWTKELVEWLDEVAEIRLKPDNKTAPAAFYYRILFDEPFGGTGIVNVARRIRRIGRQGYALRDADVNSVLQRLRDFHKEFSEACHRGIELDEIDTILVHMAA